MYPTPEPVGDVGLWLLRASFVPPPPIRELRDLTRYRVQQVRDRAQEVNRLCKVLEDAGLKTDERDHRRYGASGRARLSAWVEGTTDPTVLAELARDRLRKKLPALQAEIDARLGPSEALLTALDTIPGVDRIGAISIVADTGGDMSRLPTASHLCGWGAMCPGHNESAGKRRSGKTREGNRYLRATLIQAALGATHKRGSALQARCHRVKRHRGHKKAVVAVGHQILDRVLRDARSRDLRRIGADYFDRRHADRAVCAGMSGNSRRSASA